MVPSGPLSCYLYHMQYEILRPIYDLLDVLPDGTVPLHELFLLFSRHSATGKPHDVYHFDTPKTQVSHFEPRPEWGDDYATWRHCVTIEYEGDETVMDPGGDYDVTVWENYGIATYWGYSACTGAGAPYDDQQDRYGAYAYLDRIGFIKLQK
jgi:hypothetical protein